MIKINKGTEDNIIGPKNNVCNVGWVDGILFSQSWYLNVPSNVLTTLPAPLFEQSVSQYPLEM